MGLNWRQGFEIIQCLPSFVQVLREEKNTNTGSQDSHLAILAAFARTKLKSSEEEAKKNTVRGPNCRSLSFQPFPYPFGSWTMPRRRCLYPFQVPSAACAVLDHFSQQEMTQKNTLLLVCRHKCGQQYDDTHHYRRRDHHHHHPFITWPNRLSHLASRGLRWFKYACKVDGAIHPKNRWLMGWKKFIHLHLASIFIHIQWIGIIIVHFWCHQIWVFGNLVDTPFVSADTPARNWSNKWSGFKRRALDLGDLG